MAMRKINSIVPPVGFLRVAGARPGKVSGRILSFSRSHKGFSCIIFAGARRRIASSDGGSTRARIKGGKRGRRDAKNDGGSCGAEERNRASVVSRRQNKSHELYWLEPMKNEQRDRPPFHYTVLCHAAPCHTESSRIESSRVAATPVRIETRASAGPMGG